MLKKWKTKYLFLVWSNKKYLNDWTGRWLCQFILLYIIYRNILKYDSWMVLTALVLADTGRKLQ